MGGNAFKITSPIHRDQIVPTTEFICQSLDIEGFSSDYAINNLMGSAGKQDYSNDLDFALNTKFNRFYGEEYLTIFNLKEFEVKCQCVLGKNSVNSDALKGGQLNTLWPINGLKSNGSVQVDFITGNPQWLKFSHWSPGRDISPWKGVLISTMLGVLTKRLVDFIQFRNSIRYAKIGLYYDLENGLNRKWFLFNTLAKTMCEVNADEFETKVNNCPRLARIGYIDNPEAVIQIIFKQKLTLDQVDTFEKLVQCIHDSYPEQFNIIKRDFIESFLRSGGKKVYTIDEIGDSDVWNCKGKSY